MKLIVIDQPMEIGSWVMAQFGAQWLPGQGTAIGLLEGGEILGGVAFEACNGVSICLHVASSKKGWVSREYLRVVFTYVFGQLGCKKAIAQVGSGNTASQRFVEGLGFVLEATLTNAHPDGNLLIYTMGKGQCRWIKQRLVKETSWENQVLQPPPTTQL